MKNVLDSAGLGADCSLCVCVDWWVSGAAFELNYIRAAAAAAPAAVWQFVIFSKWQLTLPAVLDQQAS